MLEGGGAMGFVLTLLAAFKLQKLCGTGFTGLALCLSEAIRQGLKSVYQISVSYRYNICN